MAGTTNTYNSGYTGLQVDDSVSNAPIGLTAAQLVNPAASKPEILNYSSSKIIIVTEADSAPAAKKFTVGSLWHVVGGVVQPLGTLGNWPPVTTDDVGKFAVVGPDGSWTAVTMQEWQGGNY